MLLGVSTGSAVVVPLVFVIISFFLLELTPLKLGPLGWRELGAFSASTAPADVPDLYGFADADYGSGNKTGSSIWLRQRKLGETALYLGLVADSTDAVDAAYAAALKAGAEDRGAPAERTYFAPGYYAANVADFDGNRLEFVHKRWNS